MYQTDIKPIGHGPCLLCKIGIPYFKMPAGRVCQTCYRSVRESFRCRGGAQASAQASANDGAKEQTRFFHHSFVPASDQGDHI